MRPPQWRTAATVCGRQQTSPHRRSATCGRSNWPAPRFDAGPPSLGAAWGHERLGRYLWASGQVDESRSEFALAAGLLSGDEGAEAALVFAGLGQADLMSGRYAAAERWCAKVFDVVPSPDDNTAAWVMARRVLGIVCSNQGDPDGRRPALPGVGGGCHQRSTPRTRNGLPVCRTHRRRPLSGGNEHSSRCRRRGTPDWSRHRVRLLLRLTRLRGAHPPRPMVRGRNGPRPPTDRRHVPGRAASASASEGNARRPPR